MMDITLYRLHGGDTTIGVFIVYNEIFFTAEDTAKILPAGTYICELVKSTTNKSAGLDVAYAIREDIKDRGDFRFAHVGNSHLDIDGCVAIGLEADIKEDVIRNSIKAVKKFYKLLDDNHGLNPIKLTIKEA